MKKLSAEEAVAMNLVHLGNMSPVYLALLTLGEGEHLHITRKEWTQKKTPTAMTSYIAKRYGKKYRIWQTASRDGWVVKRLK